MKHRAWNKYNKLRSTENWNMYCKARNYATFQVKTAKNDYERNIARQIKHNPKCFWKMLRDKTKVKQGIQSLITKDGDTVQDDRSKAELLNSFFVSVFTEEDKCDIPSMQDKPFQKPLEDIEINETKVKKLLQKLKLNKSPGSDEINNKVLYEIKEEIVTPLTDLFRGSLDSGVLPKEWKVANITPIFKKGKNRSKQL